LSGLLTAFLFLLLSFSLLSDVKKKPISVHDTPTVAARGPKAFLKKCVKCGREIPIASEECQYCGTKQPEYVEP
jgi:rRNA maturation endonuclease Nob1